MKHLAPVALLLIVTACGSADDATETTTDNAAPASTLANAPVSDSPPSTPSTPAGTASPHEDGGASSGDASADAPPSAPSDPNAGAGPKPAGTCSVSKDSSGFFTRTESKGSYVAYVPASYDGSEPVELIVGLHGCGDSAYNFATWGVNPYDGRKTQKHIGISIGGEDGNCWNTADDDKVLAAVADISSCFWVHQKKVVLAGYSSGGIMGYRVALSHADKFAGLLVEDSGLYGNGNEAALLAGAAWKMNIAHITHTSDPDFPLAQVQADWAKITAAGFPLVTTTTAGDHNGTSTDWVGWLIPKSLTWVAP